MVTGASITLRQLQVLANELGAPLSQAIAATLALTYGKRDTYGALGAEECAKIWNSRYARRAA
jgi:hypothetical protein